MPWEDRDVSIWANVVCRLVLMPRNLRTVAVHPFKIADELPVLEYVVIVIARPFRQERILLSSPAGFALLDIRAIERTATRHATSAAWQSGWNDDVDRSVVRPVGREMSGCCRRGLLPQWGSLHS